MSNVLEMTAAPKRVYGNHPDERERAHGSRKSDNKKALLRMKQTTMRLD